MHTHSTPYNSNISEFSRGLQNNYLAMSIVFENLLPSSYKSEVIGWLHQDCPSFDIGGYVVGSNNAIAILYCKNSCILAGVPFVKAICDHLNLDISWLYPEGSFVDLSGSSKIMVAKVSGKCCNVLLAERTCLNILSRCSGIASAASRAKDIKLDAGWHGYIAGTRKTTPGFKIAEKYALLVGGVATHRMDLSQMVMLKDNHINSCGSIEGAVKMAKIAAGFSSKIEVECSSVKQALEAASAGADIIMLDNFTSTTIHDAAKEVKDAFPNLLIEASGGITEETMINFMSPYIDIISRGDLTQGYSCIDFSWKISD